MFIDSHCHLDFYPEKKLPEIISRAKENKVLKILSNGTNPETNRKNLELKSKFPQVEVALGIYPIDALSMSEAEIEKEISFIKSNADKITAIGEVGLDLKESQNLEAQIKVLKKFISLSKQLNKPLIIHSRKAELQCIELLEKEKAPRVLMHHFSGKLSLVKRIIENSWFLSIPASVKRSEHFQNVIKIAPIQNLLCETDSPFLHPDKLPENEPANVVESYKKIAEIKSLTLKQVESEIEKNFKKLFD